MSERIKWVDVIISAGIIVFFLLFRKLFTKCLFSFLSKKVKTSERLVVWIQAFQRPLHLFFVVLGVYLALAYLIPLQWELLLSVHRIFRSLLILFAGWGIYNISASSSVLLEGAGKKFDLDASSMLIPFLSKILRFIIVVLIVTLVGAEWGFSINGLVAGMGLGSLAIALAAKDTLGNIFGGIVIILEKPFSKGDWILTPSAEGVIEDITFRSTQIRTFADSIVIVPNASLVDQPITNWSRMGKRRISFTLGVALESDRERLRTVIARIEIYLTNNEDIDQQTILVKFNDFNEQSLGIFFYFFTKTTIWSDHLTIRQNINMQIIKILDEEGVSLAYPAHRIFFQEGTIKEEQGMREQASG